MVDKKKLADNLAALYAQQGQLEAKKKAIQARQSDMERKKRTRRLIAAGAAVESVIKKPCEGEILNEVLAKLEAPEADGLAERDIWRKALIGQITERILGRKFKGNDFAKFREFLEAQQHRGNYFSRAMR